MTRNKEKYPKNDVRKTKKNILKLLKKTKKNFLKWFKMNKENSPNNDLRKKKEIS